MGTFPEAQRARDLVLKGKVLAISLADRLKKKKHKAVQMSDDPGAEH